MDPLTQRIHDELRQVEPIVSELLQLKSNWNGTVGLTDENTAYGRKRYTCEIDIGKAIVESPLRWRTLIHELIHAHSVGLDRGSAMQFLGWEEGPVELLQRKLRPVILARLGVETPEPEFVAEDSQHRYNPYVTEILRLQQALGIAESETVDFCRGLLATPLGERAEVIRQERDRLPAYSHNAFMVVFVGASRRLSQRIV